MGYYPYGTDLEQRMVDYSEANLSWLIMGNSRLDSIDFRLFQGDATIAQWREFDFVASETYLGRPFTARPTTEILSQTVADCNLIIKKFLQNIHGQLRPSMRLCLGVPAWQNAAGRFTYLPLIDQISDLGYNRVSFEHVRDADLLYYRNDQITARQLLVITRK
jgi:tRNA G10  N-methylase Trm11